MSNDVQPLLGRRIPPPNKPQLMATTPTSVADREGRA